MTWPPPHRDDVKVIEDPDGEGWLYDPFGRHPWGDMHWTRHLTNALHDAGWSVARQRRESAP